ncbi:MAG: flagellar hook-associated protein FlgL [Rubrivivax sp.]
MRVTTANAYEAIVANLQQRQQQLVQTQGQMTSGKRVQRASDDPAAAAQAERALAWQARAEAEQRAVGAARHAMQVGESALGNAGELLQQARELVVQAGNASYADSDRAALVPVLQNLRAQLLTLANSRDGTGRFVFGGQGSDGAPFHDGPAGVQYVGRSGQQQTASGEPAPLSLDGNAAWMQAADPANAGGTISVFDALDRTIAELQTPGRSSADVAQTVRTGLSRIDAVAQGLSLARTAAGTALQRIDAIDQRLGQDSVLAQQQRSNAEDLDLVQAISEFQAQQTGYDAALKAYATVQRMSLFQYLG